MRKLFKWVFRLLILLVVLVAAAVIFRNPIAKTIAQGQIRKLTGFEAQIGKLDIGLSSPTFTITDFRLINPAGFGGKLFVDIPEIHVEYDRTALSKSKLHFKVVRFNLAEVNVVESQEGKTNVELVQSRVQSTSTSTSTNKTKSAIEFTSVDKLYLTLGKVHYSSMKTGSAQEINLDIKSQEFDNVKSAADLSGLVVAIMLRNGVPFLGNGASTATGLFNNTGKSATEGTRKLIEGITSPFKK
jgi:uncharacterized protein involved in outer membrane biogenesis